MNDILHPHTNTTAGKTSGITHASASLSAESRQALRILGNLALKLADGEFPDAGWLDSQIVSVTESVGNYAHTDPHGPYLTVAEAFGRMRIGRSKFYDLLHKRQLKTATIGARRMVPSAEVDRYMASRIAAGDQL
ncbi:excisionase family DNA-binding protein [Nocardia sp. NPDC051052]|uniref:excisionase family DNA-binding protein n=1 Tax=Nocardia sp. NPDC051052 TaxID=3364322 RepID=UPI00379AC3C2